MLIYSLVNSAFSRILCLVLHSHERIFVSNNNLTWYTFYNSRYCGIDRYKEVIPMKGGLGNIMKQAQKMQEDLQKAQWYINRELERLSVDKKAD